MGLSEYTNTAKNEGNEKHVPFIKVEKCSNCEEVCLKIKVGQNIFHPSTKEHHIEHIGVHGLTKDNKLIFITRFELGNENTIPYVITHIKKDVFKKIFAVSLCNLHGLWENTLEIND